jgi:malate synthase
VLRRRALRQAEFDAGKLPGFLAESKALRESGWQVARNRATPRPPRRDHRATDRKMVINALNCGASTFMADFEDANCPTWDNMVSGQANLLDAVRRRSPSSSTGRQYSLERQDRGDHPAAARLAPGREARASRTASPSPARSSTSA